MRIVSQYKSTNAYDFGGQINWFYKCAFIENDTTQELYSIKNRYTQLPHSKLFSNHFFLIVLEVEQIHRDVIHKNMIITILICSVSEVKKIWLYNKYAPVKSPEHKRISQYYILWCEILPIQYVYSKVYIWMTKALKT